MVNVSKYATKNIYADNWQLLEAAVSSKSTTRKQAITFINVKYCQSNINKPKTENMLAPTTHHKLHQMCCKVAKSSDYCKVAKINVLPCFREKSPFFLPPLNQ